MSTCWTTHIHEGAGACVARGWRALIDDKSVGGYISTDELEFAFKAAGIEVQP